MGLWVDFKKFATQGNFVTMAVGIVVGLAVSSVVTTLVSSVITPLIGVFFHANFATIGMVTVNGSTFTFGALLGALLNFIIVLVVIFLVLVYPMAQVQARRDKKAAATTRSCPECASTIPIAAKRCGFCTQPVPPPAP